MTKSPKVAPSPSSKAAESSPNTSKRWIWLTAIGLVLVLMAIALSVSLTLLGPQLRHTNNSETTSDSPPPSGTTEALDTNSFNSGDQSSNNVTLTILPHFVDDKDSEFAVGSDLFQQNQPSSDNETEIFENMTLSEEGPLNTNTTTGDKNGDVSKEDRNADEPTPTSWPNLVGTTAQEASDTILADTNNSVDVYIVPQDSFVTADYVTTRVRIFVDDNEIVTMVPRIG